MKPTHKALAKSGTYTTREGTEKTRWHRCGPVWAKDNGSMSVRLESLPVGFGGELLIVADVEDEQPQQPQRRAAKPAGDFDDPPF